MFPNVVHGRVMDLQGRAYPTHARRSPYLNRPAPILHLYNAGDARQRSVILYEGIPDTLSMLVAGLRDTGACGLYGTDGWQRTWLPLFRRARRVYVALDRDATDRAIALRARVRDPRARPYPAGGPRAEGRSQRLAKDGSEGRSRRVSVHPGASARDEPHPLGASDPAVSVGPGAVGSRGPRRRARPPM